MQETQEIAPVKWLGCSRGLLMLVGKETPTGQPQAQKPRASSPSHHNFPLPACEKGCHECRSCPAIEMCSLCCRTGDNPPPFAFGEMTVASGRYRVVYRLVGGVYLMLVAAPQSNVLWLLELISACVRILIAVSRGVEVTPDKLARRYPEVSARPCQCFCSLHSL